MNPRAEKSQAPPGLRRKPGGRVWVPMLSGESRLEELPEARSRRLRKAKPSGLARAPDGLPGFPSRPGGPAGVAQRL